MNRVVLDASASIAAFANEPGTAKVAAVMEYSAISAVNLSEICAKLISNGTSQEEAFIVAESAARFIYPFDTDQALLAGALIQQTKPFGLSFGDRACLALALTLKAEVYTTDRAWKNLDIGIPIHLIR